MRFSFCYRIAKFKGFFWSRRLFLYRKKFLGIVAPVGLGVQFKELTWLLMDGTWVRGQYRRASIFRRLRSCTFRLRNMGIGLLKYSSPRLEAFWPTAWNVLRQMRIRTVRGRRYRLGLPARNQRTHSNARTTRRLRSYVVAYVRDKLWFRKLWEPRKSKSQSVKNHKVGNKRPSRLDKNKQGSVRTKKIKKFDVWR
jgi:hypothetical protein